MVQAKVFICRESDGSYSCYVDEKASVFLLLSGISGHKVREEHEKLNQCSILFVICVITYVISLIIMGMEDIDFEDVLSGIMVTIFLFLLWGIMIARAYIYKRKRGSDKENEENEA